MQGALAGCTGLVYLLYLPQRRGTAPRRSGVRNSSEGWASRRVSRDPPEGCSVCHSDGRVLVLSSSPSEGTFHPEEGEEARWLREKSLAHRRA